MANLQLTNSSKLRSNRSNISSLSYLFPEENIRVDDSHNQERSNKRVSSWKVASNLLVSFKYAWAGVVYAFATQRNFRIHTLIATVAISLGFLLHINTVEMSIISLTSALVMVLELLNTAIESVVDLTVKQTYHELAKIAKDCAAGAVLISAIAALLVASFILLPHALNLIV